MLTLRADERSRRVPMAFSMTTHAVPVLVTRPGQASGRHVPYDRQRLATVVAESAHWARDSKAWPREIGRTDLLEATFLCQPCLCGPQTLGAWFRVKERCIDTLIPSHHVVCRLPLAKLVVATDEMR